MHSYSVRITGLTAYSVTTRIALTQLGYSTKSLGCFLLLTQGVMHHHTMYACLYFTVPFLGIRKVLHVTKHTTMKHYLYFVKKAYDLADLFSFII